jgi:AcrR family transcriptional regulator
MGVAERRAREKEELRAHILEAAAQLFVEEGFDNVSMRKIADRIEYSPATIYLYFKDKSELVQSICAETFDLLRQELEALQKLDLPAEQMLRKCLRTYIDFGLSHPQHYIFTLCLPEPEHEDLPHSMHNAVLDTGMRTFDNLRQGLKASMDAGVIVRQDLETTAQVVWVMMHGVTSLLITSRSFPFIDRETLIESTLDHILRSLKT